MTKPSLNFKQLEILNKIVTCPLVLHGSSGIQKNDCFHFPFFFDFPHSHICYLHVEPLPRFDEAVREKPEGLSRSALPVFMMSKRCRPAGCPAGPITGYSARFSR